MIDLFHILQETWAVRALLASSLVGIMCGILGCFIVLRNMSLVGDALAHAILPGVVVAFLLVGYSTLAFFTGSVLAGLLTAVGITWIQHRVNTKNDAAIGIVFTAMFSLGVIGISYISRNQGVHLDLKDFLFGNVLGVADTDLMLTGLVTLYVILSVVVFYRYLFVSTFQPVVAETMGIPVRLIHYFLMLLLSFAVVASLQTVGVILVVAMLITPAATALLLSDKMERVIVLSAGIGLLSAVAGLVLAIILNTTPGPAIAVTATFFYLLVVMFAPKKGLVAKAIRRRQLKLRIDREDILKAIYRSAQKGQVASAELREKLDISLLNWQRGIKQLRRHKWLENQGLKLTALGEESARRLVRAHRLWETYLATEVGLDKEQIHIDAERHEHLLPEAILSAVDEKLGYPQLDPHGSPIPRSKGKPAYPLSKIPVGDVAVLSTDQDGTYVSARLWEEKMMAGTTFKVIHRDDNQLQLDYEGRTISLPFQLADQINVVPAGTF
ncbi:iron chelate uptake ABC transporter family permease subunit [Lewinella sp. LCG006]|uniref:metal ABC transporter permease n=1 Tax=Lewinella sp. LCG006 TaxID=3231911 RepID=UPI00345F9585